VRSIYFDYNATTPLDTRVRAEMDPYLSEIYGNPSSVHHIGRQARASLDEARDRVAAIWKCKPSEVVFTSGGTESNNLAIFGTARMLKGKKNHLITSQIEHHAVLHAFHYLEKKEGFRVTYLPVTPEGWVEPTTLKEAITADTGLVSIMAANNETGAIQPVEEFSRICRESGILFHTDAVQSFGKLPFVSIHQFGADMVSACAHKFHGPKGSGALFIRSPLLPDPIFFGGGHENERRAGTENLPAIWGFMVATELFIRTPVFDPARLSNLVASIRLAAGSIPGVHLRTQEIKSLPNTLSMTVEKADSISLMAVLDLEGICASSGSACSAGSLEPSHVMKAMGIPPDQSNALIRFSLGRDNTTEEVEYVAARLLQVISQVQAWGK
jgi:cysteine desulfurase